MSTNYKFFPNDEESLDFVLGVIGNEILLKSNWALNSFTEAIQAGDDETLCASEIVRYVVNGLTHAMSIVRLITGVGAQSYEKERVQERVSVINNAWPNLPSPPEGLRDIRNNLEHFESRLDAWVTEASEKGHYKYIDLNVGMDRFENTENVENLRNIDGDGNFNFWDDSVNINMVIEWMVEVEKEVRKE